MKIKNLLFINALLFTFFSTQLRAQNCVQLDYYGESHNVGCGGNDCVDCITIPYNLICDNSGLFNVIISITESVLSSQEESMGYYIQSTGNFNGQIDESGQFISFIESEGTPISLTFKKMDASGNLIAYGEINETSPPCSKGTNEDDCPPNSNFDVTASIVYFDETYMVKYDFINGVKPYQIFDNNLGQFFDASIENNSYYLGQFKYGTDLNTTIIDDLGCNKTFIISADLPTTANTFIDGNAVFENALSLLSNPVRQNANAELLVSLAQKGKFQVETYSLEGKKMNTTYLNSTDKNEYKLELFTQNFTQGMYLIMLKNENGQILATQKMVLVQ